MDILVPPFDSHQRKSNMVVATFNLVATIVGGGVLSLPLAFEKCGIVLATILMLFAAIITDLSLYLLCLCARQTGVSAYGEVGRIAYGQWMEWSIALLLFVFLLFVLVAYMVLVRDIWTPVVGVLVENPRGDLVLLGVVLVMVPFLVQKELHALRYNCYVGFASISILCVGLCHHAVQKLLFEEQDDDDEKQLLYVTSSFSDILFAFPIITLSFLSSFNVLPIQSALIKPSKARVRFVIAGAVAACFSLMYVFGLAGYLCFGYRTEGNILLNLNKSNDWIVFVGRIGCGTTIMLAMAMMELPCRDNILELLDCLREKISRTEVDIPPFEETPLVSISRPPRIHPQHLANNPWWHYGMTGAIVLSCYLGAVAAPGVAIVWSLCGSCMAFLIAFILPAACYLKFNRHDPSAEKRPWIIFSWGLLAFSVAGAICCTVQTTWRIIVGYQ